MAGIPPYPPAPHPIAEDSRLVTRPWLAFFQQLVANATAVVGGMTQLTGDVLAGPGSGSQVATIANNAVTNAKLADMTTQHLKGRNTAGTGDPEDITISQALDWL